MHHHQNVCFPKQEGKEREIHHFWYTNWPDFGKSIVYHYTIMYVLLG